jgi:hypothetical protein
VDFRTGYGRSRPIRVAKDQIRQCTRLRRADGAQALNGLVNLTSLNLCFMFASRVTTLSVLDANKFREIIRRKPTDSILTAFAIIGFEHVSSQLQLDQKRWPRVSGFVAPPQSFRRRR